MIKVYQAAQALNSTPECLVSRDEGRLWVASRFARWASNGRALVILNETFKQAIAEFPQLRSSLGVPLIEKYLAGNKEAVAVVESYRPSHSI